MTAEKLCESNDYSIKDILKKYMGTIQLNNIPIHYQYP